VAEPSPAKVGDGDGGQPQHNGDPVNGSANGVKPAVRVGDEIRVNGAAHADASTSGQPLADAMAASKEVKAAATAAGAVALAGAAAASVDSDGPSETDAATSAEGTPYAAPSKWARIKGYSTLQRSWEIWSFAAAFFFRYFLVNKKFTYGKEGMTPERVSSRKRELAKWLVQGLVRLGPTFIKIGQQFSTRVDVLSKEFIEELEQLQDRVPPFDSAVATKIVESSLGAPIADVFEEFEEEPIAAASLGQVHLATLKQAPEGFASKKVVVKVQRPGLKELFDIDLKNVRALAVWFQKIDPKTDGTARDWVAIYDECSRILYQEIDYRQEANNADRFRDNFKGTEWVTVPRVVWEHTSPQVMVMEYMPGIKINRKRDLVKAGLDEKAIAKSAVESYLIQILRHGFFHADPHPGNVSVDPKTGKLIYYDFGMMGQLKPGVREGLLKLFYGVYQKDPDRCIDALVQMGVLIPNSSSDNVAIRRVGSFFLNSFETRLQEQRELRQEQGEKYEEDFKGPRSKEESKNRRKQILESIGEDLLSVGQDQPFRFPAEFTFVVRSFTVLDGIGKALDKKFDITEISAPYARGLLLESRPFLKKWEEELKEANARQNRAVGNLFKSPNMIEDVANFTTKLERGEVKLRVRALEAERAIERVGLTQKATVAAVVASAFVNVGTVLAVQGVRAASTAAFGAAGFFGLVTAASLLKVKKLVKKEEQLLGRG